MKKIILIGADHHNMLGVIESLGQKGIRPYVVVRNHVNDQYVLRSKYVKRGWLCLSDDEMYKVLTNNFNCEESKPIIYSCDDTVTCFLDANYENLKDLFILPISARHGEMATIMDKQYMTTLASKVGLTVPKTWVVTDNKIPSDIEFPCITKAISSVKGTKDNIAICNNVEELSDFLKHEHCDIIQIQTFIDKAFEFQFLGFSFDDANEILITGRTNINRPKGIDNTFFLSFDTIEPEFNETVEKAKAFIQETKYNGPFSIEFLRGKDGKNYFTEMNFRNDGNAYCQTSAGINIPYIAYLYYTSQDYKKEIASSKIHKVFLMPEIAYLRRVWVGEVSMKEYIQNCRKADCFTTYFKEDKALFVYFLYQQFGGIFVNKIKKILHIK